MSCQVIHMLCESMGIRAVSRITRLHRDTVMGILAAAGKTCAELLDAKVRNVNAEFVQADEIHSFVFSKQRNTLEGETERGDQFTFIAVDRDSKLIISHVVGKRTKENAITLLSDLKSRLSDRVQLTTDNWQPYSSDTGSVRQVFGNEVDYATETKYFAKPSPFLPMQLISVRRRSRIGSPDMDMATTAHAERSNLSARTFTRRFTRCTLGYSKTLDNLRHAVALFVAHFNFCRVHSAHGMTPARAAGLTDHTWTIKELIAQ